MQLRPGRAPRFTAATAAATAAAAAALAAAPRHVPAGVGAAPAAPPGAHAAAAAQRRAAEAETRPGAGAVGELPQSLAQRTLRVGTRAGGRRNRVASLTII